MILDFYFVNGELSIFQKLLGTNAKKTRDSFARIKKNKRWPVDDRRLGRAMIKLQRYKTHYSCARYRLLFFILL